jgi:hypothetical protein
MPYQVRYLNYFIASIIVHFNYYLIVIPSLKDKLWWKKYLTSLQLVPILLNFIKNLNIKANILRFNSFVHLLM